MFMPESERVRKRKREKVGEEERRLLSEANAKWDGAPDVGETALESANMFCVSHVCLLWEIEHACEWAAFDIIFDG